jgi:hypothetical protein
MKAPVARRSNNGVQPITMSSIPIISPIATANNSTNHHRHLQHPTTDRIQYYQSGMR